MAKTNFWATLKPNHCYHIYNQAVGDENLFIQPRNYDFFWQQWNKYISPYFTNYAFCLMPNHFHMLSKAKDLTHEIMALVEKENTKKAIAFLAGKIAPNTFYESQFKRFFTSFSNAINKQEERRGSLFKAKFKRTLAGDLSRFKFFIEYIHHNPIHHGFCASFEDWPQSSYLYFINEKKLKDLSTLPVLRTYANLESFVKAHQEFKDNFEH